LCTCTDQPVHHHSYCCGWVVRLQLLCTQQVGSDGMCPILWQLSVT
jgi:hypothetical protein